jgi:alkanesulfonate monooxygenase SsuD/methylene tetrahydromethanopterin reductase-like flavin-dependent oxidoreductase (luciferase family)
LLGNERDIAASLQHLSELGIDGVLLSWLDYEGGLRQFGSSVMPLLESAGLRQAAG